MAEGRGYSMGEEVGVEWELEAEEEKGGLGLCQIRPLTLLLAKEVTFFSRVKALESLVIVNPGTGVEPRVAGIDALTEGDLHSFELI